MNDSKMIELFLNEVCKDAPLSREQEAEVWEDIAKGDPEARDKIMLRNMRMVVAVCGAYVGQGAPTLDLYLEGFLGLHEAAKRFKPALNFKFTSYAVWWIRQRVVMALAKGQPGYSKPIRFFMEQRALRRGEEMTELAASKVERMAMGVTSTESGKGCRVLDFIKSDQAGPGRTTEHTDTRSVIDGALDELPERERRIIKMFFGLGGTHAHSLREVAERIGVSRERVRQIKRDTLEKLKRLRGIKELCPMS